MYKIWIKITQNSFKRVIWLTDIWHLIWLTDGGQRCTYPTKYGNVSCDNTTWGLVSWSGSWVLNYASMKITILVWEWNHQKILSFLGGWYTGHMIYWSHDILLVLCVSLIPELLSKMHLPGRTLTLILLGLIWFRPWKSSCWGGEEREQYAHVTIRFEYSGW